MKNRIPYNSPAYIPESETYISQALQSGHLSGDGPFTRKAQGQCFTRISYACKESPVNDQLYTRLRDDRNSFGPKAG